MSLTGYLNEQNVDLINVFETIDTIDTIDTNITSGPSGLQISVLAGNTGPLNFQTNGTGATSQNVNITSSGNIYLSPTQTPSISITNTGITLSPNGTTSLTTNTAGAITCFNQWYYGVRVIANTVSNQTYTLLITDPRNIFFTGTLACNLIFPATPPNGTEYFIRKTSSTPYFITVSSPAVRSFNTEQTGFGNGSYNSGVVYSTYVTKWICFNISS
jgi:hypothetical protein